MAVAELRIPIGPELDTGKTNAMVQKFLGAVKKMTGSGAPKLDGEALGVNELMASMGKLSGTFVDNTGRLNALAETGRQAMAEMLAGGKGNTVAFSQMAEEVKKNVAELGKLKEAQATVNKLTGGGDDGGFLQKAANINQVSEGLGRAGDAIDAFAAKGTAANQALKQMQAQTGANEQEMEKLSDQADAAFRLGVGENLDEAISKIGKTKQVLGDFLPTDQLAEFTAQAEGMGKTFDKDFNEVIMKSAPFLKQFGLDGKAGADLVALGLRDATTSQDDFLDTLSEYSNQAKEAGLSSKEFIGILTKGGKEAAFNTDKILDSIKETGLRIQNLDASKAIGEINGIPAELKKALSGAVSDAESGKISTLKLLGLSADAIKRAVDTGQISKQLAGQLQTAIAGTPSEDLGREMYRKMFSGEIDVKGVTDKMLQAGNDALNSIAPTGLFEKVGRELDLVTTKASQMFAPVLAGAGDVLKTVSSIGPGLALAFEKGPELASKLLPVLAQVVGGLGLTEAAEATVGVTAEATWASVLGPLLPIVAGIAALVAAFVLAYNNIEDFRQGVDALVSTIEEVIAAIIDWVSKTYEEIKPALEEVGKVIVIVGKAMFDYLVFPIKATIAVVSAMVGWLVKMAGKLFDSEKATKTAGDGVSGLSKVVQVAVRFLTNLRSEISGVSAALSFTGQTFVKFFDIISSNPLNADKAFALFDDFFTQFGIAYEKGKKDFIRDEANSKQQGIISGLLDNLSDGQTVDIPVTVTPVVNRKTATVTKKKDETKAISEAAKALEKYNQEVTDLDTKQQETEGANKQLIAEGKLADTLSYQLLLEGDRLDIAEKQLSLADDLVKKTNLMRGATDAEKKAAQKAYDDAKKRLAAQKLVFTQAQVRLVPTLDEAKLRELERESLKMDIELGAKAPTDMLAFLRDDLRILEERAQKSNETLVQGYRAALDAERISRVQFDTLMSRLAEGRTEEQLALENQLAAKKKEIRDIEYAAAQKANERATAIREKELRGEIEREGHLVDNALRLLEQVAGSGLDQMTRSRLDELERRHERELIGDEQFESERAAIEADAASRQAAIDEGIRAAKLEAERQTAIRELEILRDSLEKKLAIAAENKDAGEVSKIGEQLSDLEEQIKSKGGVLSGLAGDLQGNLTQIFGNLIAGDEDQVKDPFRRSFGALAGALQQLATAKITEVVLGAINGVAGIPGLILGFAAQPLVAAAINGLLAPMIRGLLSFATGGHVATPTLAMVGDPDPGRYGTSSEWIFRDDQLRALTREIAATTQGPLVTEMQQTRRAIEALGEAGWILDGNDITLSTNRTKRDQRRRTINTRGSRR